METIVCNSEISLKDIRPNPYQPRKTFDEESLQELSESIKNDGLIQPIVVTEDIENVSRASEAKEVFKALGVWEDVVRAHEGIKIRAGKGKMRGRKYIEPKSVLVVISRHDAPAIKAFSNFPGVDIVTPNLLSILHLAPGGVPGRLMIIDIPALDMLRSKYEVISP